MSGKEAEKSKKERILIIEDDFANAMGAMMAFKEDGNVEDIKEVATYKQFLEILDTYKPTIVLSDAQIPEDNGKKEENYMDKISAECEKRKIPHIFVTGVDIGTGSHVYHTFIVKKEANEYKKLKEFPTNDKEEHMWKEAYQKLKEK